MSNPQFAILRFAKYKGPEISNIEAHNERTKEKYASNPDIDKSRSHLNFHLITPERKYRAESEKQIAEAGCRTRSDSVRVVEALVTATPEFFKGKKKDEIKAYFQEALDFIKQNQNPETIISAVVHAGKPYRAEAGGKDAGREKGAATAGACLFQDPPCPGRAETAEKRQSKSSLPSEARKRLYHSRRSRPLFQGERHFQAAEL